MTGHLDKCMKTNSTKTDILTRLDMLMKTHKISILPDIFMKNNDLHRDGGRRNDARAYHVHAGPEAIRKRKERGKPGHADFRVFPSKASPGSLEIM